MASQDAAEDAKVLITIIITVCLLIGFAFIVNFPSLIAAPITKLTEAIKAVAHKNYSHRIHLDRKDEFGEMADAFNNMAEQLDKYEHSNLSKIMFEKQRAETVINAFKDASIGIDNKGVILFANEQALQLLNMKGTDIAGKAQDEIKKKNDLFFFLIESDNKTPFKVVVNDRENYFTKEDIEITSAGEKLGRVITVQNITSFKEMDVAVETSVMAVNTTAKEKKVLIEQKTAAHLPYIQADPDKIGWVLNNFLTNAIKYSPEQGTILINVRNENNHLSFAVTDQGPGIDDIYLDRIFERYFQVPGRSDKKGSGIGLAICKEFIEAMGGAIWVKSKPGEGSTFGFTMPAITA
jgi:signal transduction histidine kinase